MSASSVWEARRAITSTKMRRPFPTSLLKVIMPTRYTPLQHTTVTLLSLCLAYTIFCAFGSGVGIIPMKSGEKLVVSVEKWIPQQCQMRRQKINQKISHLMGTSSSSPEKNENVNAVSTWGRQSNLVPCLFLQFCHKTSFYDVEVTWPANMSTFRK